MKIDDRNAISGSTAARTGDIDQARGSSAKGSGASFRLNGDSVELSGASVAVSGYNAARDARLHQIAKSVQNGSYSVQPSLISKALVSETLVAGRAS